MVHLGEQIARADIARGFGHSLAADVEVVAVYEAQHTKAPAGPRRAIAGFLAPERPTLFGVAACPH